MTRITITSVLVEIALAALDAIAIVLFISAIAVWALVF